MNSEIKQVQLPLTAETIASLHAGDVVHITGKLYTGRDAAHQRMCEYLEAGKTLPIPMEGTVIYYAGPCPPKPGEVIGSIGPTTASRMDAYSPTLMASGLIAMIGKGARNEEVIAAIKQFQGIYFSAIGGIAALMGKCVKSVEIVAFEDLGTEAIRQLEVEALPVIVTVDSYGSNLYERSNRGEMI